MVVDIPHISVPIATLVPREIEILTLTAQGKTVREISEMLHVSRETIKAYMNKARHKLRAINKTHAVAIALMLGIIMPYQIKLKT
jgi:DNA-binding CsgD family transcriptional regulator